MARRLLLYASYKYNRGPVVASNKYPYRPSRRKDISYKYNREPTTSNKYL